MNSRLWLSAALSVSALAFGQSSPQASSKHLSDEYKQSPTNTSYVSCGDKPPYKARTAVSPVLLSPNGENAAYVKVRLSLDGPVGCSNETELFVRSGKNGIFKRVVDMRSSEQYSGNGIKLVDWSPDSNYLLLEILRWQYASDAGAYERLGLYDVHDEHGYSPYTGNVFPVNPADCLTSTRALGFINRKHFLIKAHSEPYFDPGEDEPRNKECAMPDQLWSVRIGDSSLKRVSNRLKPPRFGTVLLRREK
jgi:hypothetical protein